MVDQADSLVVLTLSDVTFLRHGENNGFCPIIWNGFLHPYIIADVVQLVNDAITTMLQEFAWNLISSWGFPCFQLFDSCYNFKAKDGRLTKQWLGPKVGALRQEESMVG